MKIEKCGIYKIICVLNDEIYIGSSKQIYTRWSQHRYYLRKGTSNCRYLQHAWSKYGENSFYFSILEECPHDELEVREQHYIDTLRPAFNSITDVKRQSGPEQRAKMAAALRARAALVTHCPRGHAYDEANTYFNKKGKRICRACNAARVASIYAAETPEETEERNKKKAAHYASNMEVGRARNAIYAAEHRKEKAEYDRLHRAEHIKRKREKRQNETPEQREKRLAQKRASYQRSRISQPEA